MNEYPRRKFCHKCGTKTEEVAVRGSFDTETGKPNTRDICTNETCVDHCDFYNKHKSSGIFKSACRICGVNMINEIRYYV